MTQVGVPIRAKRSEHGEGCPVRKPVPPLPVRLLVTSRPLGPAVFGLLQPTVVLPQAVLKGKSSSEIEPIVAHELVHLRRGDVWVSGLQTIVQLLWWFHPLVWWANRQASRVCERCCDEAVVADLGYEPYDYARCLLDVMEQRHALRPVFAFPGLARRRPPCGP